MNVSEAFLGIYCNALRVLLPVMTGQECRLMLALALHKDDRGVVYPGVRLLNELTTFPTETIGTMLDQFEARQIALCAEPARYDFLKKKMVPATYIVNPEIFVVSDPSLWHELRVKHSNMLDSGFPVKSAQAESESQKQSHGSISSEAESTAFEGAASLSKTNAPTNANISAKPSSQHAQTNGSTAGRLPPNSAPQHGIPPGSGAPPLRPLTFQESIQVNAIRQHIADMSAKTAMELVATYGVDLVGQAVVLCERRDKVSPIAKKTGWIKSYLKSTGAKNEEKK